jgi:chromosome segregation ATPase
MSENEDFFDKLQEAHDGMATRFAELEEENAKLQAEAELSAEKLRASSHEGREAEKRIRHLEEANEKLCAALDGTRVDFSKLQTDKAQAEAQLETTNDEYTSVLAAHDGELQAFRKVVAQKDDVISNLELRIRDIISEHAMELIAQGAARKELLRQLADKDGMISHLRDKLQTARFEYDEAKCLVQREIVELQNELEARRREAGEKDRVIRATQERMARGEAERQGWEEERAEVRLILAVGASL